MIRERNNYFGKWAASRKGYSEIAECLNNNGMVIVSSYTKATQYDKPEHVALFVAGKDGLYAKHGKRLDLISGCAIRLYYRK
jgi:hypothetical protein